MVFAGQTRPSLATVDATLSQGVEIVEDYFCSIYGDAGFLYTTAVDCDQCDLLSIISTQGR